MRQFLTTIGLLTIIPVKTYQTEDLARSMVFFPLVGLLIGGFLVGVRFFSLQLFPPDLVSVLVIAAWVAITGCLHLDGFCDTIDGLAGGRSKEEIFRIIEESAVGCKGVVAVVCLLLIKTFALSANTSSGLLIAPTMGRWAMVAGAATSSYPKSSGLGRLFVGQVKRREFLWATLIMMGIGFSLFGLSFFYLLATTSGITWLFSLYLKKRVGGFTGDTLGALSEVIEVATLLSIVPLSKR
ncbi:MAG: adenosylcobinamide-GDP ribazoletransferase [bacterium]